MHETSGSWYSHVCHFGTHTHTPNIIADLMEDQYTAPNVNATLQDIVPEPPVAPG